MTVILRDYQQRLKNGVYAEWHSGVRNVIAVMPTGAGKTAVMADIFRDMGNRPCLAIAHRQELVSQISLAFARAGIHHNIIAPTAVVQFCIGQHIKETRRNWHHPNAPIAVAGVQTILRRGPKMVQWCNAVEMWAQDECHHLQPGNSWGKAAALFPHARGLGVTATPIRCDKKPLGRQHGGAFDAMVVGPTMRDLIEQGHLTEYRLFAPAPSIDLSNVKVSDATGDYNADSLRKEAHKSTITGDIVEHYMRIAPGKRGITFTVDVEQAKETAARFNAAGVAAEAVSAKTPDRIRQKAIDAFSRGDIKQLVNVDLFGEGFDVPAVEVVSKGRPTQSFPLDQQQSGRALRPFAGKEAGIIIDHVGNWKRHGLPDQYRHWSLDMQEIRKSRPRTDDELPLTACVECFRPFIATKKVCPYCGHVVQPASRGAPEYVDGDLIEFSAELLAKLRGDIRRNEAQFDGKPRSAAEVVMKRNMEARFDTLQELRDCINLWAGIETNVHGRAESESYRRFYHFFGVDVLTAQTLPAPEMRKLTEEIRLTFTDT